MAWRKIAYPILAILCCVPLAVVGTAEAVTDRWSTWAPIAGTPNNYTTTMQQRSAGFPAATVASDSRSNVQIAGGASTFLGAGTPPGAKYGSSSGSPYAVLRAKSDTATGGSTTTYTFAHPTPDTGWAFVLGDIDADQVRIRATDADGGPVPAGQIDSWFRGAFNYAGGIDLPTWDGATSTLTGNPAASDTDGASGWFEPAIPLSSLTMVFTRRSGFPVYQTWFVSRARPIGGTVDDISTTGSCPVESSVLTLIAPGGEELATTSPAADGSYTFGEFATQAGYVVRLDAPAACAVVGTAELTVSNRGNDGSPESRADFQARRIVPQPISGTVRDDHGAPVAGVTVTLQRPGGGGTVTTTTADDGTYLFDDNAIGSGYTLNLGIPDGYAPTGPTTIGGIAVAGSPITDQDFVVRALPTISGQVTGGGSGLGGVQVVLTPAGGGSGTTTATAGDGTYSFPGVQPGGYTISVVPPEGYGTADARAVTSAAADLPGQDFALPRPGAASGQVTSAAGTPATGVTITVDGPGGPRTTITDAEGGYFVDGLPAGSYTATATGPPGYDAPPARSFTITAAGEIRGGLDFALTATAPSASPSASATPSTSPSANPSASPTDGPSASPSQEPGSPTASPSSTPGTGAGDLPNAGGPALLVSVVGAALLAVGAGLVGVGFARRRKPEGKR